MDLSPSDWDYVTERAGAFVGREWVFERVRGFLSGPPGTFLLRGDPGTGKTAVAARLAQGSCRRPGQEGSRQSPVSEGAISAGVFCRAGAATAAELARRLSDQLAASVDGFAGARLAVAGPGVTIGDVSVVVEGDVHAGGAVTGVALPLQDGKRAFSVDVAEPLRQLRAQGQGQPVVLLVDAVDEAADPGEVNIFARLLGNLDGVHLIVTCRPDPAVLAVFRAAADRLDLIADAPADDDDMRRYIRNRLTGQGPGKPVNLLASRIAGEAHGNFLYAFHVTGTLIGSGSLAGLDEETARGLPLPTGGLAGVYEDFLDRQIAGDETKWAERLGPVLAPLCVASGDGLTAGQLSAIAGHLTGREFSLTSARQVTRLAGQFLDGLPPDGPFRVYHQSFTRFLTDPVQNPNWPIDITEANSAVARGLIGAVPEDRTGTRNWALAHAYARRYLATHAAAAGILDDLLLEPAYLLAADPIQLLPALSSVRTARGRALAEVVRRASHHLLTLPPGDAASYLELRARQQDLHDFADAAARLSLDRRWRARWARWRARAPGQSLGGGTDGITALSAAETGTGNTLAVVGRRSGAVEAWDLALSESLAWWHPDGVEAARQVASAELPEGQALVAAWAGGEIGVQLAGRQSYLVRDEPVTAMCLADRAGRAVCVTAHVDGRLVMRALPQLDVIREVHGATHADIFGLAVVTHHGQRVLMSANDSRRRDSAARDTSMLRMWSLHDLSPLWEDHLGRELGVLYYIEKHQLMGRAVAVVSQDSWGPFQLWDLDQRALLLEGDEPSSHAWAYEHDGEPYIFEARYQHLTARHIEAQTGHEPLAWALGSSTGPIETEGSRFTSLVSLHGRGTLLSAAGGYVKIWDLQDLLHEALRASRPAAAARAQAASPVHALTWGKERQGELYAAASDRVLAFDAETGAVLWEKRLVPPGSLVFIKALALAPQQDRLAAADSNGYLHMLDLSAEGREDHGIDLDGNPERICIAERENQTLMFAAVNRDRSWGIRIWDLDRGEEIAAPSPYHLWAGEEDKVMRGLAAVAGRTGIRLAFASKYSKVMVDDFTGSRARGDYATWRIPDSRDEYVNALAASQGMAGTSGGSHALLLAAGTQTGTIVIWDFTDGTLVSSRPQAHLGDVHAMQFGRWSGRPVLATGGDDGILRIWTTRLDELLRIEADGPINTLAFLGPGQLAVGGQRGVLMLELHPDLFLAGKKAT